jgi:hypothetical protein
VTSGDSWSAANHNLYIRDNFADHEARVLAAEASIITLQSTGLKLISEQILASPTATIDFSSIPATFRSLKLICDGRTAWGGPLTEDVGFMTLNGDSGSNYCRQWLRANNSTVSAADIFSGLTKMENTFFPTSNTPAGLSGISEVLFPNYSGTIFCKKIISECTWNIGLADGNFFYIKNASFWNSTTAINRITITTYTTANFVVGSTFSLYGIV